VSRTQISTQDVTQLCHEIRDIKKGPINNRLPDDLSKISSNIPGQWDIRDKHVLGYAENAYNKLRPVPPSDNHDSLARRDSSPPPGPPPPAQTPPGPPPVRTPSPTSGTSVGTPYAVPCRFWVRSDRPNLAYDGNPRNRSRPSVHRNIVKIRHNVVGTRRNS